jgi:hypothetical protein
MYGIQRFFCHQRSNKDFQFVEVFSTTCHKLHVFFELARMVSVLLIMTLPFYPTCSTIGDGPRKVADYIGVNGENSLFFKLRRSILAPKSAV